MNRLEAKVLMIDDDEDILLAAKLFLKQHIRNIHTESSPENLIQLITNENYDVILLDMNFEKGATSGKEGFYWLDKILKTTPGTSVILITSYGDLELAVQAIKEGATDFVMKPWKNEKLLSTIEAALKLHQAQEEITSLKEKQEFLLEELNQSFPEFIGESASIRKVLKVIEKVSKTDANILVLGENGTGKQLIARMIHHASERANEIFVNVDLGAISESLFESELFGHKKGAYTDAREDRAGRFEIANNGTLFLDEIGNLSIPLQAKLLSVIQSRKVTRLGSNKEFPVNIRLICATNMSIHEMVKSGQFRQDLLYRINTVEIYLPPLRERIKDIPLLVKYFISTYCKRYSLPIKIVPQNTMKRLEKHSWPGNIRELQHAIERAVILSESEILQPEDFFINRQQQEEQPLTNLKNYNIEQVEKMLIRKVLDKNSGNISKSAKELGLTRAALYRRLEKYGI